MNCIKYYCFLIVGYAGKTPLEEAQADAIVDCFEDMFKPMLYIFKAPEEKKVSCVSSHIQ